MEKDYKNVFGNVKMCGYNNFVSFINIIKVFNSNLIYQIKWGTWLQCAEIYASEEKKHLKKSRRKKKVKRGHKK